MSQSNLCLHVDAFSATREQVNAVKTPAATKTHYPISHQRLIEQTVGQLEAAGIRIAGEKHGLTKDGLRYFGVFDLAGNDGANLTDYCLALGLRNSHDKSIVAGMALGTRVFVCDNKAFSGEVRIARKHTRNIDRDFPKLMADAVRRIVDRGPAMNRRIDSYKNTGLHNADAHDIMVRSIDTGIVPAVRIPAVLKEWREPSHDDFKPRNAWSLFNAYTEVLKGYEPHEMAKRSRSLYGLFDAQCGVLAN